MRKTLLIAALSILSLGAFAQEGRTNIGLNMAFASPILRERSGQTDTKLSEKTDLYGWKIGFVLESSFWKGLGVQLGVNYTLGSKIGSWQTNSSATAYKYRDNYVYNQVEIPVDWQYKFTIAKETYLMLYTGPTIQCGITFRDRYYLQTVDWQTGKTETIMTKTDRYEEDYDLDGKHDLMRVNVTWGVGAGFQYKNYFLRGGYDFGIINPYYDTFFNSSTTDTSLGWYRKGRFDQWSLKLGIYIWQFGED